MALIKCPECDKEVSDKAQICVHCGFPLLDWMSGKVIVDGASDVNDNDDKVIVDGANDINDNDDKDITRRFHELKSTLSLRIDEFTRKNRRISKKIRKGDMSENYLNFMSEICHDECFVAMKVLLKENRIPEIHRKAARFFMGIMTYCYYYIGWPDVKAVFEDVDFSILETSTLQYMSECLYGEIDKEVFPIGQTKNPSVFYNMRYITYGYLVFQVLLNGNDTINKELLSSLKLQQTLYNKEPRIDYLLSLSSRMGIDPQEIDFLKKKYPTLFESLQNAQ